MWRWCWHCLELRIVSMNWESVLKVNDILLKAKERARAPRVSILKYASPWGFLPYICNIVVQIPKTLPTLLLHITCTPDHFHLHITCILKEQDFTCATNKNIQKEWNTTLQRWLNFSGVIFVFLRVACILGTFFNLLKRKFTVKIQCWLSW